MKRFRYYFCYCLMSLCSFVFAQNSHADTSSNFQRLASLIHDQKFSEAYSLGNSMSTQESGNPNFDYLFGVAAIHTGHPEEAAFAFERVLTAQPHHDEARFVLARTYLLLGNTTAAKIEFETLLNNHASPTIRAATQRYLNDLATQPPPLQSKKHFHVGLFSGYDSNANSSPDEDFISTPTVSSVPLLDDETQTSDSFTNLLSGAGFTKAFSPNTAVFGQVAASYHRNIHEHDFDYNIFHVDTGLAIRTEKYMFRFPIQVEAINEDDQGFRRDVAIAAEAARAISPNDLLTPWAEFRSLHYPHQSSRDNYLTVAGGKWLHQFNQLPSQLETRIYYAEGIPKDSDDDFLVKDFYGIQLIGKYKGIPKHTPFISFNAQAARYDGSDPTFLETRKDNYYDTSIGWKWQITPRIAIQPDYTQIWNHSNIALYDYQRYVAQIGVLYRFEG